MNYQYRLILGTIVILSIFLRFYTIGKWPFAGDEVATVLEERVLFHGLESIKTSQEYRLPHLIPVGYTVIHLGHSLFGPNEYGSRFFLGILGAGVSIVVLGCFRYLFDKKIVFATSLLIATWPYHIFQSQQTRFYIVAAFFSSLALIFGARSLRGSALLNSLIACLAIMLAIFSHTILIILFPIIFLSVICGHKAQRIRIRPEIWITYAVFAMICLLVIFYHIMPMMKGWNSEASWGYTISHAILGSINMLGVPVFFLAVVGFGIMLAERSPQNWYWSTALLSVLVLILILPRIVAFHVAYIFPIALPAIVASGVAIGYLYEGIEKRSKLAAIVFFCLFCSINLPSLVSHYIDGSRADFRQAADYLRKNWKEGDVITGYSMGTLGFYIQDSSPPLLPLHAPEVQNLQALKRHDNRIWLVLESGRGGLKNELQLWLYDNCSKKKQVKGQRYDYADYIVDIYYCK